MNNVPSIFANYGNKTKCRPPSDFFDDTAVVFFSIIRAGEAATCLEIQIRVGPLVNAPTAEGNRRMLRSGAGDLDTPALHILDRNPLPIINNRPY